jgi:hypothetical protein
MNEIKKIAAAVFDGRAWLLLIVPALVGLWLIDAAMVKTMTQWGAFAAVLCGVGVILTRIVFPQINVSELMTDVRYKNSTAAGLVVAALILTFGLVVVALVLWVKP